RGVGLNHHIAALFVAQVDQLNGEAEALAVRMVALLCDLDRAGGSGFGGGDLCIESALEKGVTASAPGLVFSKMMHRAKGRARFGAGAVPATDQFTPTPWPFFIPPPP